MARGAPAYRARAAQLIRGTGPAEFRSCSRALREIQLCPENTKSRQRDATGKVVPTLEQPEDRRPQTHQEAPGRAARGCCGRRWNLGCRPPTSTRRPATTPSLAWIRPRTGPSPGSSPSRASCCSTTRTGTSPWPRTPGHSPSSARASTTPTLLRLLLLPEPRPAPPPRPRQWHRGPHAAGCPGDGAAPHPHHSRTLLPIKDIDRSGFEAAVRAAEQADVCVAMVGDRAALFRLGTSGEGCDAEDLSLPGVQGELVEALLATDTPLILLVISGRPYVLGAYADGAAAVVQAFFPGEEGGPALAGVLSGGSTRRARCRYRSRARRAASPAPTWTPHSAATPIRDVRRRARARPSGSPGRRRLGHLPRRPARSGGTRRDAGHVVRAARELTRRIGGVTSA
ncbi:glycoside hydrolase family 3 protein [Streptomyces achromogenes]|uniref:glycoside hydrolase family 3 protein n=1 Tax=Streptomyces achromogenes TaxID=67255 RepID=UPI001FD7AA3F|nr:glycoside hydrolase family 3 C-terminal domain-containing protein [Streptomyces achromogenes]